MNAKLSAFAGAAVIAAGAAISSHAQAAETIKIGVLHSLSGTMAISETTLKDTMLMLVDDLNKKGGLLGRKVEAVVVDPASNWPLFAEKARELLAKDKVAAVFGCWTSVSRKSVLPVFEELNGLLFYPVQYEVDAIELHYGASRALRGVSLSAEIGKITCVLGRNGVGKTSLLGAIVGRHPVSAGRIRWDDRDITGLPPSQRAALGIAYVPRGREIFPLLTVEDNLRSGFAALPRGLRHVPDEVFELFPVLGEMLARRGGDLSGGQQQQLAIARALVMRPRLLVLDEPTEGIQPSIIKDIERVIRHLAGQERMAILLVEQYFEFARGLADSFAVMDRGEVVLSGTADDMVEDDVRRHLTV